MSNIVTNCSIDNTTDYPIRFITHHNWNGQVDPNTPYPKNIKSGQRGKFTHISTAERSKGAVVYRIKNAKQEVRDWMLAWDNPGDKAVSTTSVYTEIRGIGHFTKDTWPIIEGYLDKAGQNSTDTRDGCTAELTINEGSPADFHGIVARAN